MSFSGVSSGSVRSSATFIKNNGGIVRVTLSDLPEGNYQFTSYHLDPSFDQSNPIQVFVDSGAGFSDTGATGNADFSLGGAGGVTTESVEATQAKHGRIIE